MNFREVTEKLVQDPVGMAHHVEWNRFDAEDIECVLRKNPQVLDVVDWSMVRGSALASLLKGPFAQEVRKASGYNHVMTLSICGYGYGVSIEDFTDKRLDELAKDMGLWLFDYDEVHYVHGLAMDSALPDADSFGIWRGDSVLYQSDGDSSGEVRLVEVPHKEWFLTNPPGVSDCQTEAEFGVCVVDRVKAAFHFDVATKSDCCPSNFVIHYRPEKLPEGNVVRQVVAVECEDKVYSMFDEATEYECDDKGPRAYLRFKPIHGLEIFKDEIIRFELRIVSKNKRAALAAINLLNNENADCFIDDYIGHFVVLNEAQEGDFFVFDLVGFSTLSGRDLFFDDVLGLRENNNARRGEAYVLSLNRFCRLNGVGIESWTSSLCGWSESLRRLRTDVRYVKFLNRVAESQEKRFPGGSGCGSARKPSHDDLAMEAVNRFLFYDQERYVVNMFGVTSYLGSEMMGSAKNPFGRGKCRGKSAEFLPAKEIYAYRT